MKYFVKCPKKQSLRRFSSYIPAYILGKGINRLDTFEAPKLLFSTAHLESILGGLKLETSKLKRIHLGKGKISTDSGH